MTAGAEHTDVLALCRGMPLRQMAAGQVLLEEGRSAGVLYVLATGAVEIVKGEVQITTVSEPGSVFGEVSILLETPHMATVRTLQDSTFYVAEHPLDFLRSQPELALSVCRLLARRLQFVTTYLVDLKRQFAGHDDHFALVDEVLENLVHHQAAPSKIGSDRCPESDMDEH